MAKTLILRQVEALVQGNYANPSDNQLNVNSNFTFRDTDSLTNGTGENQADLVWDDTRSVASGANDDIDLAGLTCVDVYGATLTFVEIRGFMIKNTTTTSGDYLGIGGGGATEWTGWVGAAGDYVQLHPNGVFLLTAPGDGDLLIGAGATDILRIHNFSGANAITYDIYVWGTSA